MQDINKLDNLLSNVSLISKKYDEIAKITGENFNIFSVLSMERKEVKTHSAFLGELLNPKGSHGLNDIFLRLFINQSQSVLNFEFEFETNSAIAFVEESLGKTNKDKTEGGRIDIVIKDIKGNIIVIENKIDAGEQKNQLIRYNNAYPKAIIFFLTLTGYKSETTGEFNYFQISYEENIKNWLEECLKETVNFPMLREVIKQYIYLINKLTNQTINKSMSEEIKDLIKSNIKSASTIYHNYIAAKHEVLNYIRDGVFQILINKLDKNYCVYKSKENIDKYNSSIIIKLKKHDSSTSFFCINSFSGLVSDEKLFGRTFFIGILDFENRNKEYFFKSGLQNKGCWYNVENISNDQLQVINFGDLEFLNKLDNTNKINHLIEDIVKATIKYIDENEKKLAQILER